MLPTLDDRIHITNFVRRQTAESHFSHWSFDDTEFLRRIRRAIENGLVTEGYRAGVVLAQIDSSGCFTGQVKLVEGDKLVGVFEARRAGETPRKTLRVFRENAEKVPSLAVDVVLYHWSTLKEGGDNETEDAWEVVAFNARPTLAEEPIHPETLMHNHFGSDGGTDTGMSPEEFEAAMRKSFGYWKDRAILAPRE